MAESAIPSGLTPPSNHIFNSCAITYDALYSSFRRLIVVRELVQNARDSILQLGPLRPHGRISVRTDLHLAPSVESAFGLLFPAPAPHSAPVPKPGHQSLLQKEAKLLK